MNTSAKPIHETQVARNLHEVRREILVKLIRALKEPAALPPDPPDPDAPEPATAPPGNILPFHHSNP